MGADWVLDFFGQNNLLLSNTHNPYVQRFLLDVGRSKYFDLSKVWQEYTKPLIFYFWSGDNGYDIEQFDVVKDQKSFLSVCFRTKRHGKTMYNFNVPIVLNMQKEELLQLHARYFTKQKIGGFVFSVSVCGLFCTCKNIIDRLLDKLK